MTEVRANRLAEFLNLANRTAEEAARIPCSMREYIEGLNVMIATLEQDRGAAEAMLDDPRVDTLDGRESRT